MECGRSSGVEHHVANVRVVSSNLIARSILYRILASHTFSFFDLGIVSVTKSVYYTFFTMLCAMRTVISVAS